MFEALEGKAFPDTLEGQEEALRSDEDLAKFAESRRELAADPYRPLYHFSPPGGTMNDPHYIARG